MESKGSNKVSPIEGHPVEGQQLSGVHPRNSGFKQSGLRWVSSGLIVLTHRALPDSSEYCLDAVGKSIVAKVRDTENPLCRLEHMKSQDLELGLCTQPQGGEVGCCQDKK